MAASPKRVSWDACSWIALIQQERIRDAKGNIIEDRYAMARSVIDLAQKGAVEIAVSGLCLVEVNKPSKTTTKDQIVAYFENDYILIVPVDKRVAAKARELMFTGHAGLKPPDATHLATALVSNADEMHTFDERLLDFDGQLTKLDGTVLKICKPAMGGKQLPLLERLEEAGANGSEAEAEKRGEGDTATAEVRGDGAEAGVRSERGELRSEAGADSKGEAAAEQQAEEAVTPKQPPQASQPITE